MPKARLGSLRAERGLQGPGNPRAFSGRFWAGCSRKSLICPVSRQRLPMRYDRADRGGSKALGILAIVPRTLHHEMIKGKHLGYPKSEKTARRKDTSSSCSSQQPGASLGDTAQDAAPRAAHTLQRTTGLRSLPQSSFG